MQFRPHGAYEFGIDGRVLRIAVAGSLNQEGLQRYREQSAHYFAAMAGAPWGALAVIAEGGFLLDGTRDVMIDSIRQQQATGRCATAAVLPENLEGRSIFEERLRRFYSDAGQPYAMFVDESSAREWLLMRIREASTAGA